MTHARRHRRWTTALAPLLVVTLAAALAAGAVACRRGGEPPAKPAAPKALVSSIRAEPRTFNRCAGRDSILETFTQLTQARLVRINRNTQALEPWLAESWTASADGLAYTIKLRPGLAFSDGAPFTSADVLFTFRAAYDEKLQCPLGDSMRVAGKPLEVSAPDPATVVVKFPSPFGPGLRLLDNLPILPAHRLRAALDAGTMAAAWGVSTPPSELAGMGPFVLKSYQPGQRLVFERNPRYWRTDERGARLPRLDRLTLEVVPDQNAELVGLQSDQIDFTQGEVRPEDYATLRRAADQHKLALMDLGTGLDADTFWINLRPTRPGTPRKPWLDRVELRRAIAHAVDRQAFAETVFLGAAVPVHGAITPGNTQWFSPTLPRYDYDPAEAKRLLASIGLVDRDGDGLLEDRPNNWATFTILTQKGNTALERGANFIAEELRKLGLDVKVAALESGAAIDRIQRGEYEAVYFRFLTTDLDPALNIELWVSWGGAHVWYPSQPKPATEWEKQVDELMARQVAATDFAQRKALFDQVQRIVAEQQPMIQFVAPRVFVATSNRVEGATPALLRPMVLWNADAIGVK